MSALDTICRRFDAAGLPLELATSPLTRRASGVRDIVQLDIERQRRRERFRVWPGHKTNRVEVVAVDRRLRQLVLLIEEHRRRFVVEVSPYVDVNRAAIIRVEGRRRWIEQFTNASKRHLLCGVDEGHLFIAGLPRRVTSVRNAHAVLRNPRLDVLERSPEGRTLRQGEWFFVPLPLGVSPRVTPGDLLPVLKRRTGISQAARLGRAGRAHVADEVLVVRSRTTLEPTVYVRGAVRHPDHRTVFLLRWHLVLPNAEPPTASPGLLWVD